MATRNRPAMAHRAAHAFFDQDYDGEKTLFVYDDSDDVFMPCRALRAHDLKWWHVAPMSLPRKRNRLVQAAARDAHRLPTKREIIYVIWDDDDLYGPRRVQHQVDTLRAHPAADGCVVHPFHYFDDGRDVVRQCTWPLTAWPCIRTANASLAFRYSFWARVPWDEAFDPGSGPRQLAEQPIDKIVAAPFADDYTVVRHGKNHAGDADLTETGWVTCPLTPAEVRARLQLPLPCGIDR